MTKTFNILFLCTGNSVRSILAEAILNRIGGTRLRAYSAGSHPTGKVNPGALALLENLGYPTEGLRSKSWDEFAADGAPPLDFIITVCDNAAGEICPVWPGKPTLGHWGVPDPAAATGDAAEITRAFKLAYRTLKRRIEIFASLPIETLDLPTLKQRVDEIGHVEVEPVP